MFSFLLPPPVTFHNQLLRIACKLYSGLDMKLLVGLCHGFSLKWIEAEFLGDEVLFHKRITDILDHKEEIITSIENINSGKKSFKDYPELIENGNAWILTNIPQMAKNLNQVQMLQIKLPEDTKQQDIMVLLG